MGYWYAVHTISGKELRARESIKKDFPGVETLFPQRHLEIRRLGNLVNVLKPLFPGYFFINTNDKLSLEKAQEITKTGKSLKEIIRILGAEFDEENDDKKFVRAIHEDEIKHVLFLTRESEVVDFSEYVKAGERVRIISGPLKGFESMIKRVNPRKKRITISLSIFGVEKEIDLGGEMVERLSV